MVRKQSCLIWIQTRFHYIHKNRWYLQTYCRRVESRFDSSNYELEKPLQKGKSKKVTGLT